MTVEEAPNPRATHGPAWTVGALISSGLLVVLEENENRVIVSLVPAWAAGNKPAFSYPDRVLARSLRVLSGTIAR